MIMNLEHWCWLAIAACALHIVEEFALNWRGWVKELTGIEISQTFFWTMNLLLLALGAGCASIASRWPTLALGIPALMLINATVFHVGAWIWLRGRFSPGLITSLLLFYPIAIGCYHCASKSGLLTGKVWAESLLLGLFVMAAPMALLRLANRL
jgi:hypothetical protein